MTFLKYFWYFFLTVNFIAGMDRSPGVTIVLYGIGFSIYYSIKYFFSDARREARKVDKEEKLAKIEEQQQIEAQQQHELVYKKQVEDIEKDASKNNIFEALAGLRGSLRLLKSNDDDLLIIQSIDDFISQINQETSNNPALLQQAAVIDEIELILDYLKDKDYGDDMVSKRLRLLLKR